MWIRRLAIAVIVVYAISSVRLFFRPSSPQASNHPKASTEDSSILLSSRPKEDDAATNNAAVGSNGIPPPPATLLATFGSASMSDFILNWAANMVDIPSIKPYVVFALDEALYQFCIDNDIPTILISEYLDRQLGGGKLPVSMQSQDKSKLSDSLGSSYYRHNPDALRNMGATKALLLHSLLLDGYDVILSDADTVWMNDPWDWIPRLRSDGSYDLSPRQIAREFQTADMLFSTDRTDPVQMYDANAITMELNSGIFWIRSTNASILLMAEWHFRLVSRPGGTYDQAELNWILKGRYPNPGVEMTGNTGFVSPASWPYVPASILNADSTEEFPDCSVAVDTASVAPLAQKYPSVEHTSVVRLNKKCKTASNSMQLSNLVRFRHPQGPGDFADGHKDLENRAFQTFFMWDGLIKVGLLPLAVFLNGMSYFTFRVHERLPVANPPLRPIVVHATFQYADEPAFAYGKRQRFREFGLWKIDPDSYFEGYYIEISDWDNILLRIVNTYNRELEQTSPELLKKIWECKEFNGHAFRFPLNESLGCFHPGRLVIQYDNQTALKEQLKRVLSGEEDLSITRDPAELHIRVQQELRLALRNAFALGRATDRAVIFPELWCFCARYWWLIYDCSLQRQKGIMSTAHRCPQDHNIMPGRLFPDKIDIADKKADADAPQWDFREQGFLSNPRVSRHILDSQATLTFPTSRTRTTISSSSAFAVEDETIDSAIAVLSQSPVKETHIISISGDDLLRLNNCGYSSSKKNELFNKELNQVFPKSQHITFCSAERNPQNLLSSFDQHFRKIGKDPGAELKKVMNCTGTNPSLTTGFFSFGPPPFQDCSP